MTSHYIKHNGIAVTRRAAYLVACAILTGLMAACGSPSAAGAGAQSPAAAPIAAAGGKVTLDEYKLIVPSTMKAGNGNFHIINSGVIEHELLVFKSSLDVNKYPVDADGRIKEEDPAITKISDGDNLPAGGTQDRSVDLSKPGKYVFVCNLPSHYQQGMFAAVTVTP
jgi:uncharacterized cupredoxin-like copper-binding protein